MFAFHCEDYDLYSINYLHTGAPKSWYSIPVAHKTRFETLAATFFPEERLECKEFLRHKNVLLSPKKLREHAIDLGTVVQYPGIFYDCFFMYATLFDTLWGVCFDCLTRIRLLFVGFFVDLFSISAFIARFYRVLSCFPPNSITRRVRDHLPRRLSRGL